MSILTSSYCTLHPLLHDHMRRVANTAFLVVVQARHCYEVFNTKVQKDHHLIIFPCADNCRTIFCKAYYFSTSTESQGKIWWQTVTVTFQFRQLPTRDSVPFYFQQDACITIHTWNIIKNNIINKDCINITRTSIHIGLLACKLIH